MSHFTNRKPSNITQTPNRFASLLATSEEKTTIPEPIKIVVPSSTITPTIKKGKNRKQQYLESQSSSSAPEKPILKDAIKFPDIFDTSVVPDLITAFQEKKITTIIVDAPTGVGKTVGISVAMSCYVKSLSEAKIPKTCKGFVSMPYRVSVKNMYKYLNSTIIPNLRDCPCFNPDRTQIVLPKRKPVIGYAIKGDSSSERPDFTDVQLNTTGYLLEKLITQMKGVAAGTSTWSTYDEILILLDEAHDSSWMNNLLIYLVQYARRWFNIIVIIASATLNIDHMKTIFKVDPLLFSVPRPGGRDNARRVFLDTPIIPVENDAIAGALISKIVQSVVETVEVMISPECTVVSKNILVILPGKESIDRIFNTLAAHRVAGADNIGLFALHSQIELSEVDEIFDSTEFDLKIILATNMVENAITIDKLGCLIDSGLRNINYINSEGVSCLKLERAARSNLVQAIGRVGRQGEEGLAYLMMTEIEFNNLPLFAISEATRNPLHQQLVRLYTILPYTDDVMEVMHDIRPSRIKADTYYLVDNDILVQRQEMRIGYNVTRIGDIVMKLPLSVKAGRFIALFSLKPENAKYLKCAALVAAAIEMASSPFYRPKQKRGEDYQSYSNRLSAQDSIIERFFGYDTIDVLFKVWFAYEQESENHFHSWCTQNGIYSRYISDVETSIHAINRTFQAHKQDFWEYTSAESFAAARKPIMEALKDSFPKFIMNGEQGKFHHKTCTEGLNWRAKIDNRLKLTNVISLQNSRIIAINVRSIKQSHVISFFARVVSESGAEIEQESLYYL